jgi:GTP-binding protein EngB required for normal cell division
VVDAFETLAVVARSLGDEAAAADVAALRQRIDEGRFFVACVGQFKRGKSTLINALVGDAALPVGVIPVTAVVTVVRHGEARRVRVKTRVAGWQDVPPTDLESYVAEEENPDNVKEVLAVEVYVPSPLLTSGMCLVDTPGLGSVHSGNTAATREFVPHIDAALVILGADPPISGEELALVENVGRQVAHVVFVINKADRLDAADVAQARSFTSKVIAERLRNTAPDILVVSATERTRLGPTRDWAALEARLATMAQEGGVELVEEARRRGTLRLASRLAHDVAEHRAALERPIEESERRLEAMTRAVDDAQRAVRQLEPLFRIEEEFIRRALEARRERFEREAGAASEAELLTRLETASARDAAPRDEAYAIAQAIARARLEDWAASIQPEAEELYRRATSRFVALGNELLQRLGSTGEAAFADLPRELEPEAGFRTAPRFYFTDLMTRAAAPAGASVLDAVRSHDQAVRAAHKRTAPYLVRLLETNSARLTNDLVERVRESGARLRSELGTTLRAVTTGAERALQRARASLVVGDAAVRDQLDALDALDARLRALSRLTVPPS